MSDLSSVIEIGYREKYDKSLINKTKYLLTSMLNRYTAPLFKINNMLKYGEYVIITYQFLP